MTQDMDLKKLKAAMDVYLSREGHPIDYSTKQEPVGSLKHIFRYEASLLGLSQEETAKKIGNLLGFKETRFNVLYSIEKVSENLAYYTQLKEQILSVLNDDDNPLLQAWYYQQKIKRLEKQVIELQDKLKSYESTT